MTIEVTRLPGEPILIYTYPERIRSEQEVRDALEIGGSHEMEMDGDIYIIHDASRLKLDFSEMLTTLAVLTREMPNPQDMPRIRLYAVGSDQMVQMAAKASAQDQYGGLNVAMFDSLDAALADIRARIAVAS